MTLTVPQETLEDLEIPMMADAAMSASTRGKGKGKARAAPQTKEKRESEGQPEYAVSVDCKHGELIRHNGLTTLAHFWPF